MIIKILKVTILIVILTAAGWVSTLYFYDSSDGNVVEVSVAKGSSAQDVAQNLNQLKLVKYPKAFVLLARLSGKDRALHAGVFEVSSGMSYYTMLNQLTDGKSSEVTFLIREGEDLRDVAQQFMKLGLIDDQKKLFDITGYPGSTQTSRSAVLENKYSFLKNIPAGHSFEGYLFPDSYRVAKNESVEQVLSKFFDNFQKKYEQRILGEMSKTNLKLDEVITLASIISKEGRTQKDKQMIAGVFLNRLKIGMALQSDPTVNYITQKQTDNPSLSDIAVDSTYNTYKNPGLPPGAIGNPGLEDILAVLNPAEHNYYFFLNTQTGEMIYSKTFDEHVMNRGKYGQ